MYGKFHASAFTGSMRGSGAVVFAVWAYVVSNTNQHSVIEINPDVVAFLLGCQTSEVETAIEVLCAPDPKSRCKDNDGRRLLKEGEYQYFVPTHKHYREMKTTEEKREYNRVKKQEERQRKSNVKPDVKNVKVVNTTEAEADSKAKTEIVVQPQSPPSSEIPAEPPKYPDLETFCEYFSPKIPDLGFPVPIDNWLMELHGYLASAVWPNKPPLNWKAMEGKLIANYRDRHAQLRAKTVPIGPNGKPQRSINDF